MNGISFVTFSRDMSKIEFKTNEVVCNSTSNTYELANKSLAKVEAVSVAVDILADLISIFNQ